MQITRGCYHVGWNSCEDISQFFHGGLKRLRMVTITGFCYSEGLIELTHYILKSAASSLQCISLDATPGYKRKHSSTDRCRTMCVRDFERALSNVRQYVEPKIPEGVELKIFGSCRQCHYVDAKAMEEAAHRSDSTGARQHASWHSTRRGRTVYKY